MLVLTQAEQATLLKQVSNGESTPADLEKAKPGVLQAMRFSVRHYLHWCHTRGWDVALPPGWTVKGPPDEDVSQETSEGPDWAALVAAAPEKGVKAWLKEQGIPPVQFYRARKALKEAA